MYLVLALLIPSFFMLNCVVLNVYNGDIFNIPENLEYMLWFLIPLIIIFLYCIYIKSLVIIKTNVLEVFYLVIGILYNIYWYYAWKLESNDYRHRTEYYDTQTLLCCISYILIVRKFDSINSKKIMLKNKKNNDNDNYHIISYI